MFRVCDTKECIMATNNQNNLEKDQKVEGHITPDFKTYCKTTVIKSVWYQHKDRHTWITE